jgi:hypothetical protein
MGLSRCALIFMLALPFLGGGGPARALPVGSAAVPLGEPVLEPPTLRSLGVYWIIRGDENQNARVEVDYRAGGRGEWRKGPPLFRVERGAHQPGEYRSRLDVPADAWLFAGSLLLLTPNTPYGVRLRLSDPDGGNAEKLLKARTIAEPVALRPAHEYHVVPGSGGGGGTSADPFRGLAAAQSRARPGDRFLLHAGVYAGTFQAQTSGEPGRPIVWRGTGDGEAIIDGHGGASKRPGRAVDAVGIHDVWFEKLTLRNADYALVAHDSARLVIRRCHLYGVEFGIAATRNTQDIVRGFFIADNVIEGPSTWPRTKGIEDARGIQITGAGHDVCYNRIRGFADAIDTFPSPRCAAIDFHNNDIHEMTDDGIEMDYSERNTRCFFNRLTNVFQGVSVQPIFGGPVYIFRNVLYNVGLETFKMHNRPSGALMIHNTSVKQGMPLLLWTPEEVHHSVYRNNLFIGTTGGYAYETTAPMIGCDFDYDGFGGGPWERFLSWNRIHYPTLADVKARALVYRHAVQVGPASVFASGLMPPADEKAVFDRSRVDLRLKPGTNAIDAGEVLPGFNDDYAGRAPDLGAYELGSTPPQYGPRPEGDFSLRESAKWAKARK